MIMSNPGAEMNIFTGMHLKGSLLHEEGSAEKKR